MRRAVPFLLALLFAARLPASSPEVFTHPASASQLAELTAAAARDLRESRAVRGEFVQRKHLRDLPRPLESTGRFVMARDAGLIWHTLTPFESRFVVTPAAIAQRDERGRATRISGQQQPGIELVTGILLALFALDVDRLQSSFELYGTGTPQNWTLGVRPRSAVMQAAVREVVITGNARIERVELLDAHGERTEILFRNTASSPSGLTAEEQRLLHP